MTPSALGRRAESVRMKAGSTFPLCLSWLFLLLVILEDDVLEP